MNYNKILYCVFIVLLLILVLSACGKKIDTSYDDIIETTTKLAESISSVKSSEYNTQPENNTLPENVDIDYFYNNGEFEEIERVFDIIIKDFLNEKEWNDTVNQKYQSYQNIFQKAILYILMSEYGYTEATFPNDFVAQLDTLKRMKSENTPKNKNNQGKIESAFSASAEFYTHYNTLTTQSEELNKAKEPNLIEQTDKPNQPNQPNQPKQPKQPSQPDPRQQVKNLDEYNKKVQEFFQFENLANKKSRIKNSKHINDFIMLLNPGENQVEAYNKSMYDLELEVYIAGLMLKTVNIKAGQKIEITVDWDGSDYEVLAICEKDYLNGTLEFTTLTSKTTKERGLFFKTDELLNKEYNSELQDYLNLIQKESTYNYKTMKLHGVTVEFHYVSNSFDFFSQEEFEQFFYINMTDFHRIWTLFEGYPQDKYYLIYVPKEIADREKINQEKLGGTIFSTDVVEEHRLFPNMYAHSIAEAWFPFLFFSQYEDDIIWISKGICEMIGHSVGSGATSLYRWHDEREIASIQEQALSDSIVTYRETGKTVYLRYLYVKSQIPLRYMISEYKSSNGSHQNSFFKDIYNRALLNNKSFDKRNVDTFPVNILSEEFKNIFVNITNNKELIDCLYDKYVYNGEAAENMPIELGYNNIIPEFYPFYNNEEEVRSLNDYFLEYFITTEKVNGYKISK